MHGWHVQEFQVLKVLEPALRMTAQKDSNSRGRILFVEKRRERLHIGECKGTQKPVILWVKVGSGFYSLFLHCLRVEMPFRCRWAFPREEKCLLDHLPLFGTSCSLSFIRTILKMLTCTHTHKRVFLIHLFTCAYIVWVISPPTT
jgi:hypothetical protein